MIEIPCMCPNCKKPFTKMLEDIGTAYSEDGYTLDQCKELIWDLAVEKKWGTDVAVKIYYAMIELGEAGDIWKHREDKKYLKKIGVKDVEAAVAEELIDTIFYCLHALRCLNPKISADSLFKYKLKKNKSRHRYYVDDWKK